MIKLSDLGQVYIVCGKTDMRRGIDTLASMVKDKFNLDPFSGQVFLYFVAVAKIDSKLCIGTVKDTGYSIKDSRTVR